MQRELASAYALSAARVASWAIVSSILYRSGMGGAQELSLLLLVRGTAGVLTYGSLGLAPAVLNLLTGPKMARRYVADAAALGAPAESVLTYESPPEQRSVTDRTIITANIIVGIVVAIAAALTFVYAMAFKHIHPNVSAMAGSGSLVAIFIGLGVCARVLSDVPGAVLQSRGRIFVDNLILIAGEIAFVSVFAGIRGKSAATGAMAFLFGSLLILFLRNSGGTFRYGSYKQNYSPQIARQLLAIGGFVVLAQATDWLYAPINLVLIERFLNPVDITSYGTVVQIDGALALLVGGLASVLLPKSAIAFGQGDLHTIRQYFLRGTIASFLMLLIGAGLIVLLRRWIFHVWLGDGQELAIAILPWVLVHTVLGGSSAVARSVLLATGRAKAFAISSIVGGVMNAMLAFMAVAVFHWGVMGIIGVTIATVTIRCGIWMPWYTWRALAHTVEKPISE